MNIEPKDNESAARQRSAYPRTIWGFLSVALICATITFAIYSLKPARNAQPLRRLWTPLVVNTDGKEMIVPDSLRLEFWTPSSKTKDYLAKAGGTNDGKSNWEIIDTEEPVMQFGRLLRSDPEVVAYRRAEVWGHGRTSLKPGWWWSVTVRTNYSVAKLARTYRGYWKLPGSVFVEVIDNRGHDEP
jgi:hypothetical protein